MPSISKIKINGTEYDIAGGGGSGKVTGVKGNKESTYRTGNVNLTPANIGALPDTTSIPSKTSDLTNDSGFITNTVNNLTNYYLKTDTYTKTEVNNLISSISTLSFEVVQTLPTTNIKTNVIYLVPKSTAQTNNTYDEYINTTGTTAGWEKIGDTEIDLSEYATKAAAGRFLEINNNEIDLVNVNEFTISTIDTDDLKPTVTTVSPRNNLAQGDTLKIIIGKIKKWFTDLSDLAFISKDGTSSTKYLRGDGTWQVFPTIPTVNNGTLTINQNSTQKGTFTANQSGPTTIDLTDTTYSVATQSANGLMSSSDKSKLDLIEARAEVNQKALSKVKVGNNTVTSTEKTGTLELVAGANISLTLDPSTPKVTIDGSGSGGGLQRSGNGDIEIELYETSDRQLQFNNSDTGTTLPIRLIDRNVSGAEYKKTVAQLTKDAKLTLCAYNGSEWEPRIVFEPKAVAPDNADYYKQLYFTDYNDTKRYILPQVLWTNSSPDATFAAQTITFDGNINHFRFYEIIYKCRGNFSSSDQKCKSTGLVSINAGTCLQRTFQYSETRDVSTPTYNSSTGKTSFAFAACVRYTSYGSSTTSNQNGICVPYQIIGHI